MYDREYRIMSPKSQSFTLLKKQIDSLISYLEKANKRRTLPRPTTDYMYARSFFNKVALDRNTRADTVDSPKYQEAVTIAQRLLPYQTAMEGCMDGRLFGPLVGLYGHIGDTLSVSGGMLHEFVRQQENQKLYLVANADFAEQLRKYFVKAKNNIVLELIDSHLGCAAREAEEIAKGKFPQDHGLLADVLQKKEMKQAMTAYVDNVYKGKKKIIAMQISLDPKNGFMYMGLATKPAIDYALKHGGYTDEVLKYLTDKEMIISTEAIVSDPAIEKIFKKYMTTIDLEKQYGVSAVVVWKAVDAMHTKLLPLLAPKLMKVHPQLKEKTKEKQLEMQERAIILLINAFTGYLHKQLFPQYPFAQHNEEGISVAKGNNPPYEVGLFGVASLDLENLASNIELSASIVRTNRKTGRVVDSDSIFNTLEGFIASPVGILMQVKVLDALSEKEWETIAHLNWEDLPDSNWETMNDREFFQYLEEKDEHIPVSVANALNKLRVRMAVLYDVNHELSSHTIDHDMIVLPALSDESYRLRCVIPFVKTGYR